MELVTIGVGQMGGYNRDSIQQPKFNERNQIMKMWFQGLPCYNKASRFEWFWMDHAYEPCVEWMHISHVI